MSSQPRSHVPLDALGLRWPASEFENKLLLRLEPLLDHARTRMIVGGGTPREISVVIPRWAIEDLVRQRQDSREVADFLRALADRLESQT
jgi:hypothetical protein